ncbi:hypothetical protein A6M21_03350 [Desulfotomaculum copahuensis]|uniref:Uncharacterized protein n=1 Tax=Desulfotomaculum copahuensis TaxID=1838280 RepID=A0A1B7LIR1_9FIRM|nr:hypothetical protein A6M21_03350 [Desulfotomaculum copahuensis]
MFHRHVGEKGIVLKDIPHPAAAVGQVDPGCAGKKKPAVQHDFPLLRLLQSGQTLQEGGFAGSGRPEHHQDLVLHGQLELQREQR